jgi:hypothetical protein
MIKLDSGVLRLAKYAVPLAAVALGIAFAIGKWAPETAKANHGGGGSGGPARLAFLADKPPVLSVARAEPGALHVLDPSEKPSEPLPAVTPSEPVATITASEPIAVTDASPPAPATVDKKFTLAAESDVRPLLARPAHDSAPAKEPKAGKSLDEVKLPRRPVAEITIAREEPRPTNRRPYASSPSGGNWRLAQAGYVFGGPVIGIGY